MADYTRYLEIDASDLKDKINMLKDAMTPTQFQRAMYGVFKDTGRHVKQILKKDLPKQYYAKPAQIASAVKGPQLTFSAGSVGCNIPIRDTRGSIGGRYSASGGAHGWNSLKRKYRVKGRIVKAGQSVLPPEMKTYGGQPPFRNLSAKRLNKVTFTRVGKKRGPIRAVYGIAIPQMPMNRSQEDVQKDILDYMENRLEHRFMALMRTGR